MRKEAEGWAKIANEEFQSAKYLFEKSLFRMVCYHSQQDVEKILKAILVEHEVEVPFTHNLIAERININVKKLPESKQIEVLDFVEYLNSRTEKEEFKEWNDFSLSSAMRGMKDEQSPYSANDLKECF